MPTPAGPGVILLLLLFPFVYFNGGLVQALTSPEDISALKAFKAAVKASSIPPWSCLGSWDFNTDPCAVPRRTQFLCGITCSADSTRVTQLVLDPAGYSGTLTPFISRLTQLTTLDLSDNSFYGLIPPSISSLVNLQTLTLRSNRFSGPVPASITNLKALESLDLAYNSLTGFLPGSMDTLYHLRRIDLSYNKITGSLPKLPENLIELALKHNSLSGPLSKPPFDAALNLEVVELSENALTGNLGDWFFLLPSLQQVNLANNNFTRVEVSKPTRGSSSLVAVDLGFNEIEGYLPANFATYPLLSSLSLRHNKLRGTIPLEYSMAEFLKRLFLDGNLLIGKPPPALLTRRSSVTGSLGDNCLQGCPASSQLCKPSQKPIAVCKEAYRGKPSS